jgi:hypothetical protein
MWTLVRLEIYSRFRSVISLDMLDFSEFFCRLALGDPRVICAVSCGHPLLASREFFSARAMCQQNLRFSRESVLSILRDNFLLELAGAERASILFDQMKSVVRGLIILGQMLIVSSGSRTHISGKELTEIWESEKILKRLRRQGVPERLRSGFRKVVAEFGQATSGLDLQAEPLSKHLEVLHEWTAYVGTLLPEVT